MCRLIDADALLKKVYTIVQTCDGYETIESVVYADQIKDAPTVDAVPMVRCKYCMWWDWGWCNNWERGTDEYGFCHDAKRKVTK